MNRGEFTRAVFEKLHIPIKPSRLYFGVALAVMQDCEAKNNPWGTEEPYPDSTDFNSAGVKNYKTWEDGVYATTSTLVLPYYKNLIETLKDDKASIGKVLAAFNDCPWGGKITLDLYSQVADNYEFYNTQVVGSPKTVPVTKNALGLAPTEGDVVPTREDVLVDSNEEENEMNEEELNAKAAAADKEVSVDDLLASSGISNPTTPAAPTTPAVYDGAERRTSRSPVAVERRAAVDDGSPAPVESDTLEDRLAKLYADVETDVKTDAEKVSAEVAKVVADVESHTTPVDMSNYESRLAKVEAFISGVTAVISKF